MPTSSGQASGAAGFNDSAVARIREFNRFYTREIGVLGDAHLHSDYSLGEVRVLYELAHREQTTATQLAQDLALDAGYLSRLLRAFAKRKLVARKRDASDGRQQVLSLTAAGRAAFQSLDTRANEAMAGLIGDLAPEARTELMNAMQSIERVLSRTAPRQMAPFVLRNPAPGDLGWILHRHGALYANEYGWDWRFEGLVAGVLAEFVANFDARLERCWVAERDGHIIGSVFVVRKSAAVAKLRLLYVEPSARGLGLGRELVREVIRFARRTGYKRLTLWTQSVLVPARRIYESEGFVLKETSTHRDFGEQLTAETWELAL